MECFIEALSKLKPNSTDNPYCLHSLDVISALRAKKSHFMVKQLSNKINMRKLIKVILLSFICSTTKAAIIEANYSFDGTNFTLENGVDVFNINYQVGDKLRLTLTAAEEGSYWDFSNHKTRSFDGFDLGFTESSYRAIDGMYYFYFDNALINKSYFYTTLDDYRGGPYSLSVRNIDYVSAFSIDYNFLNSSATTNQLAPLDTISADWSIWNTFGSVNNRVPYVQDNAISVPEPSSWTLLLASLFGVARFNYKNRSSKN